MFQRLTTNRSGNSRHDRMNGRDYLVVPMIMMTEGVHAGSGGPLFYPKEELAKTPAVWNHKPIVVYHPVRNGEGISACDPDVLTNRGVGVIMNAKFKKGKLHAEAWLEPERLAAVDMRVLEAIESDEVMELSTGLFTDNEETPGVWNGEEYHAVARNYRPDHLALLPDMKGACSIADGAGLLRTNAAKEPLPAHLLINAVEEVVSRFTANGMSFSTINNLVYTALRDKHGDKWNGWIEDMFEGFVVYWLDTKLYQQDYHIGKDGATLVGEPAEVMRVTEYRKVEALTGNAAPTLKEDSMDRKQTIDGLIANGWTEAERPFLEGLSDDRLARMAKPAAPAPVVAPPAPVAPVGNTAPVVPPVATPAPTVPAVTPTFEQLWAAAPVQMREAMTEGMAANARERETLTKDITANAANTFTPEQLAAKSTAELRSIAAFARSVVPAAPRVPYFGGAAAPVGNAAPAAEEVYVAPNMNALYAKK